MGHLDFRKSFPASFGPLPPPLAPGTVVSHAVLREEQIPFAQQPRFARRRLRELNRGIRVHVHLRGRAGPVGRAKYKRSGERREYRETHPQTPTFPQPELLTAYTHDNLPATAALESVREVYVFKHSFLSMRRIDAKSRKARAVLVRFSKSLASRRHLPSQANVLSTTHRLGMTSKPTAVSHRLTISVSRWGKIFFRAWSNTGPWYPPSAKSFSRNGKLPNRVLRTRTPPSRSWILAGCTMACSNRPTVSTRMWRFLPLIFLPAS